MSDVTALVLGSSVVAALIGAGVSGLLDLFRQRDQRLFESRREAYGKVLSGLSHVSQENFPELRRQLFAAMVLAGPRLRALLREEIDLLDPLLEAADKRSFSARARTAIAKSDDVFGKIGDEMRRELGIKS